MNGHRSGGFAGAATTTGAAGAGAGAGAAGAGVAVASAGSVGRRGTRGDVGRSRAHGQKRAPSSSSFSSQRRSSRGAGSRSAVGRSPAGPCRRRTPGRPRTEHSLEARDQNRRCAYLLVLSPPARTNPARSGRSILDLCQVCKREKPPACATSQPAVIAARTIQRRCATPAKPDPPLSRFSSRRPQPPPRRRRRYRAHCRDAHFRSNSCASASRGPRPRYARRTERAARVGCFRRHDVSASQRCAQARRPRWGRRVVPLVPRDGGHDLPRPRRPEAPRRPLHRRESRRRRAPRYRGALRRLRMAGDGSLLLGRKGAREVPRVHRARGVRGDPARSVRGERGRRERGAGLRVQ